MDAPVFKLEGVVKAKDETSDFEGPLALILQLLSKNKIEIRDISISLILEQYLEYLGTMAELDLDIAGEFVAMASHLAYIKTKMLLAGGEEVSELEQLMSSLEELRRGDVYVQIREAARTLADLYTRGGSLMTGPPEYLPPEGYSYVFVSDDLLSAIKSLISRENAFIGSLDHREAVYPQRIMYSIPEKIAEVLYRLRQEGTLSVAALFYVSASRTELIATLIAVLELCRVGSVALSGDGDDIAVTYTGAGDEAAIAYTGWEREELDFADEVFDGSI